MTDPTVHFAFSSGTLSYFCKFKLNRFRPFAVPQISGQSGILLLSTFPASPVPGELLSVLVPAGLSPFPSEKTGDTDKFRKSKHSYVVFTSVFFF